MVGRDQYGYIKGPYYMVKPGPMPPGEHNKVESKILHKLGRFPKLRVTAFFQSQTPALLFGAQTPPPPRPAQSFFSLCSGCREPVSVEGCRQPFGV